MALNASSSWKAAPESDTGCAQKADTSLVLALAAAAVTFNAIRALRWYGPECFLVFGKAPVESDVYCTQRADVVPASAPLLNF